MHDHERVHIDSLVHEAAELLCETAAQRLAGASNALSALREDPNSQGIWLERFVGLFLEERSLINTPGSCVILGALGARPTPVFETGTIDETLRSMAVGAFAALVRSKTEEALERAASLEGMPA